MSSYSISLRAWLTYFKNNKLRRDNIPWLTPDHVAADEIELIGKSIAAFQLGEHSEGRGLLKLAAGYASRTGDRLIVDLTELFIIEEQNHARLLKRFMISHGIAVLSKHWTDSVFRGLRKVLDFELSVTVLITAEIISLVYYRALNCATDSAVLKAICSKILWDEEFHVRYESELLLTMRELKPVLNRSLVVALHRFLFFCTVMVVYFDHRRVLRRGGYGFTSFRKSCRLEFAKCFGPPLADAYVWRRSN